MAAGSVPPSLLIPFSLFLFPYSFSRVRRSRMAGRKLVSSCIVIPLVALTLVFAGADRAQAQGIGFGIKGGVLFPDFRAANIDMNNKTGWQAGLFFGGNRPGIFGFQIEV